MWRAKKLEGKAGDLSSFIDDVRVEVVHFKDAFMADFKTSNLADAEVAVNDDSSLNVSYILAPPHIFIQSIHLTFSINSSNHSIDGQGSLVRKRSQQIVQKTQTYMQGSRVSHQSIQP